MGDTDSMLDLQTKVRNLERKAIESQKSWERAVKDKDNDCQQAIHAKNLDIQANEETITEQKKVITKLQEENEELQKKLPDFKNTITDKEHAIEEEKKISEDLTKQIVQLTAQLNTSEEEYSKLTQTSTERIRKLEEDLRASPVTNGGDKLKINILEGQIRGREQQIEALQKELKSTEGVKERLAYLEAIVRSKEREISDLQKAASTPNGGISNIDAVTKDLKATILRHEAVIAGLTESRKLDKEDFAKLQKDYDYFVKQYTECETKINNLKAQSANTLPLQPSSSVDLDTAKQEIAKQQEHIFNLSSQIRALEKEIQKLKANPVPTPALPLENLEASLRREIQSLNATIQSLHATTQSLHATIDRIQLMNKELNEENSDLVTKLEAKNKVLEGFESSREQIRAASDRAEEEAKEANADRDEAIAKLRAYEDEDLNAMRVTKAERKAQDLAKELEDTKKMSGADAVAAIQALEDGLRTRSAPPSSSSPRGIRSRTQIIALKDSLGRAVAELDAKNADSELQMTQLVSSGVRSAHNARSLNALRSMLVDSNGGSFISNGDSGSSVTWSFLSRDDADRVAGILRRVGFMVELQSPLDLATRYAPPPSSPLEILIQNIAPRDRVLLTSNSFPYATTPFTITTTTTNTTNTADTTENELPLASAQEWLIERSLTILSKPNISRTVAVKQIITLVASFEHGDLVPETPRILFRGDNRAYRAKDASMVFSRLGIKHTSPRPIPDDRLQVYYIDITD